MRLRIFDFHFSLLTFHMICFVIICAPLFSAEAAMVPQNDPQFINKIHSSLQCTFVRTYSYLGIRKIARGTLFADHDGSRVCYDYDAPFAYRFVILDTVIYGVDKKTNKGYAFSRAMDSTACDDLYLSIHVFAPLIGCLQSIADSSATEICASDGPTVYRSWKSRNTSYAVALFRSGGAPFLVEAFDKTGRMFGQTRLAYDKKPAVYFPSRIVCRKKCRDVLTLDSIAIKETKTPESLPADLFEPDPKWQLRRIRENMQLLDDNAFLSGEMNDKQHK
jgi:hypothetical protein